MAGRQQQRGYSRSTYSTHMNSTLRLEQPLCCSFFLQHKSLTTIQVSQPQETVSLSTSAHSILVMCRQKSHINERHKKQKFRISAPLLTGTNASVHTLLARSCSPGGPDREHSLTTTPIPPVSVFYRNEKYANKITKQVYTREYKHTR